MNYTIHDFMTERLQLKGTELLLYALVYNFSQDGNGCFYGTAEYAAKKVNCTRRSIVSTFASLVEAGLLSKSSGHHNGRQTIDYVAIVPEACAISSQCENFSQQVCENITEGVKKSHTDNISDNLNDNQNTVTTSRAKKVELIQYAEFVSMTADEYQKLIDEFGKEDADALVAILDNYKGSSGKKYKSDYRAIRSWCVERLEEQKRRVNQARFGLNGSYSGAGPRVNERGETPTVASMRAASESFGRIAARHAAVPVGVDVIPAPIDEQEQIDD